MRAKEKAVEGAGTPTAASVDEFDRTDSICPIQFYHKMRTRARESRR